MQQSYSSLTDCKKDWDENQCTPQSYGAASGYSGGSGGYYGPRYYWVRSVGRPMSVSSNGDVSAIPNAHVTSENGFSGKSSHVGSTRTGGFGSPAHGFSGGG